MPLGDDQPTLGECFRDAGYRTGYVGKWHLDGGTGHDSTIDFETTDPGFVPPARRRGYDFWRGFNCGHDHHSSHPQFRRDVEPYRLRDDEYQPTVQTDIAGEFVDRNREDRFFMFLSWGPPHPPFEAPAGDAERADADADLPPNVSEGIADEVREHRRQYDGMIASLDDELDRLLQTLYENDPADDTLAVFPSDHRPWRNAGGARDDSRQKQSVRRGNTYPANRRVARRRGTDRGRPTRRHNGRSGRPDADAALGV